MGNVRFFTLVAGIALPTRCTAALLVWAFSTRWALYVCNGGLLPGRPCPAGVLLAAEPTGVETAVAPPSWCRIGVGLTLPFFGAEAFGLQVIGKAALSRGGTEFLQQVSQVRMGPGLWLIGVGLLLVAAATILLASAVWKAGLKPRWAGLPLALGFVVYIPQLQGAPVFQPIRIVVALLITAGCVLVALGMLSRDHAVR